MNINYGCQSMIKPLRRVLVKRPDVAFAVSDPAEWNYTMRPNLNIAQQEHDALVEILRQAGAEIIYHDEPQPAHADAIFVHDPAIITERGAIVLRMGKSLRRGEEAALAWRLEQLGIPIYCTLSGAAMAEGGDLLWIDNHTLAVGQGFRTNAEGLRQLQAALEALEVAVIPVQLPYYAGPASCLHLMSFISIVDYKLAVIYARLMPVPFWQYLQDKGFRFVEVPDAEFATMGPNVLALAPGDCVMLAGSPLTARRLDEAGCRVQTYKGAELSLKAEGGPTCLTRPLLRL